MSPWVLALVTAVSSIAVLGARRGRGRRPGRRPVLLPWTGVPPCSDVPRFRGARRAGELAPTARHARPRLRSDVLGRVTSWRPRAVAAGAVPDEAPSIGGSVEHVYAPLRDLLLDRGSGRATSAPRRRHLSRTIVLGAAAPSSLAVIRALSRSGHGVVAVDTDALAPGLRAAEEASVVSGWDDAVLVPTICSLARAAGAGLAVPTVSEVIPSLADGYTELQDAGLACWLPRADAVEACLDRWRLTTVLRARGVPVPPTNLGSAEAVPGPWEVTPRAPWGGPARTIDDVRGIRWALRAIPEPLVRSRLDGMWFTVDALVSPDGRLAGAVPHWRREEHGRAATTSITFWDEHLVAAVAAVLSALDLRGQASVAGVVAGDDVRFVDVSPVYSDGLSLALAAGADLVGEYVHAALGTPVDVERLQFRPGVTMFRLLGELFEEPLAARAVSRPAG